MLFVSTSASAWRCFSLLFLPPHSAVLFRGRVQMIMLRAYTARGVRDVCVFMGRKTRTANSSINLQLKEEIFHCIIRYFFVSSPTLNASSGSARFSSMLSSIRNQSPTPGPAESRVWASDGLRESFCAAPFAARKHRNSTINGRTHKATVPIMGIPSYFQIDKSERVNAKVHSRRSYVQPLLGAAAR